MCAIFDSMVEPSPQPHTQALFSTLFTGGGDPGGFSIYCSECSKTLSETVPERLIMKSRRGPGSEVAPIPNCGLKLQEVTNKNKLQKSYLS